SLTMNRRSTRMPNFTAEEEAVLIALAYKYKSVIEKKGSNGRIWREKQLAWSKIAAEF
ncbi:CG14352, partial [Drosophila busckii]